MNSIRENDLNRVDLNLLIVLPVLHREGSVSRAASKLHLGQPAVSGALARLREMFNDPLFVRTAKGMAPTPRAQDLVTALLPVMDQMQQVIFQRPVFTPEQDQHTFRTGMSDWVERWLMHGMMADIAQMAPGIRLQVTVSDPFRDGEKVQQDKVDVAISVVEQVPAGVEREVITQMGFCTMWHPLQLSLTSPLSLDVYTEIDHLLVSYRGASSSSIDLILADCGRKGSALRHAKFLIVTVDVETDTGFSDRTAGAGRRLGSRLWVAICRCPTRGSCFYALSTLE